MRLLLDTHVLIWSVLEPHRLGPRVRRLLDRGSTEVWFSPISTWELVLLVDNGQIRLDAPFEEVARGRERRPCTS